MALQTLKITLTILKLQERHRNTTKAGNTFFSEVGRENFKQRNIVFYFFLAVVENTN